MTNSSWLFLQDGLIRGHREFYQCESTYSDEHNGKPGNKVFLKSVKLLMQRDFQVLVSLVSTPKVLARFDEAVRLLAPIGMFPVPKILRGSYDGNLYLEIYGVR